MISDSMPEDISMDLTKMNKFLGTNYAPGN
jgi:hypothetical protein